MIFGRRQTIKAWLVPYAEGTLNPESAAKLEAQLAKDPKLAAEADTLRTVAARLRCAAAEAAPDANAYGFQDKSSLWPGIQDKIAPVAQSRRNTLSWAGRVCAAAFAVVALLLHGPWNAARHHGVVMPAPARPGGANGLPRTAANVATGGHRGKKHGRTHTRVLQAAAPAAKTVPLRSSAASKSLPVQAASHPDALPEAVSLEMPKARTAADIGPTGERFRLASPVQEEKRGENAPSALPFKEDSSSKAAPPAALSAPAPNAAPAARPAASSHPRAI